MLTPWSTIGTLWAHLAHACPEREAVVWPPPRLTEAALRAHATTVARGLWAQGVRPREPVALLVSHRPEWLTTALGWALLGVPVVALGPWWRRVEREDALDQSQVVALVTLDRFLGADDQAMRAEIIPEATGLPALRALIGLGQPTLHAARPFEDVLARGHRLDPTAVRPASDAVGPADLLSVR